MNIISLKLKWKDYPNISTGGAASMTDRVKGIRSLPKVCHCLGYRKAIITKSLSSFLIVLGRELYKSRCQFAACFLLVSANGMIIHYALAIHGSTVVITRKSVNANS